MMWRGHSCLQRRHSCRRFSPAVLLLLLRRILLRRVRLGGSGNHIAMHAVLLLRWKQLDVDFLFSFVQIQDLPESLIIGGNHLHPNFASSDSRKMCNALEVRPHFPMKLLAFAEFERLPAA